MSLLEARQCGFLMFKLLEDCRSKVHLCVGLSDNYPYFSLAVHPDRITIATGQVAGTSKDGKVRFPPCLSDFDKDLATTSWRHC